MNIEIRPLSLALLDDYMNFFDHVAFSDHQEWSRCYCTHFHWGSTLEAQCKLSGGQKRARDYAIEFIRDGIIQGYLAYQNDRVVGWCNANDKTGFRRLVARTELWEKADRGAKVKAVVCFLVAPGMRGKGIATQLLDRVCRDAAAEDYEYIEAYPRRGETDIYVNYHGPYALYEKCGFVLHKDLEHDAIVRKYLQQGPQ
jgi:GNAT superfamily N-acetyltransferase